MRSLTLFAILVLCLPAMLLKCGGGAGIVGPGGMPFIKGIVKDAGGSAVPNAKVTVLNLDTNTIKVAETDINGNYIIPELNVGRYRISVNAAGFSNPSDTEIRVKAGQEIVRNFRLSRQ